jgi:hypothetical protein
VVVKIRPWCSATAGSMISRRRLLMRVSVPSSSWPMRVGKPTTCAAIMAARRLCALTLVGCDISPLGQAGCCGWCGHENLPSRVRSDLESQSSLAFIQHIERCAPEPRGRSGSRSCTLNPGHFAESWLIMRNGIDDTGPLGWSECLGVPAISSNLASAARRLGCQSLGRAWPGS